MPIFRQDHFTGEMAKLITETKLIDLQKSLSHLPCQWLFELLLPPLEHLLALKQLNALYVNSVAQQSSTTDLFQACLEGLQIQPEISALDLQKIPRQGPLVVVANHPFGGLEGLMLGAILIRRRPDIKYLGNYLLQQIPEFRKWLIPVDPFGHRHSVVSNARALKTAIQWVQEGGALVTFPAGEVSHLLWTQATVADTPWSLHLGAIIRRTRAAVLPVYFRGQNSRFFQSVGLIHPRLRTLLLPRELMNKRARRISVAVGNVLPGHKLTRFDSDAARIAHLRLATYCLEQRYRQRRSRVSIGQRRGSREMPSVIAPMPRSILTREIDALPAKQCLVDEDEWAVYLASGVQIPVVLREIGRLRELTFRAIHEGSGKPIDLDRFDTSYLHLFVWQRRTCEVVGAYRLGLADAILQQYGSHGLYTSTLFRFKPAFCGQLQQAIELGRAFIRNEYQRQHGCLWLLWRGIAAFLVQHPQYTRLFGPVSISQDYRRVSKNILIQFLRDHRLDAELAHYVSPRTPYRGESLMTRDIRALHSSLHNVEDVSQLIADLDDGKEVPVLLRYYLGLGATLLGFNLDKKFSNVIDALILIDLTKTNPRVLRRVMGPEGFARYTAYQGRALSAAV